jgi:hemerythrin
MPGGLHVVREGRLELADGGRHVEDLAPGAFFGEDLLLARRKLFEARALADTIILQIPQKALDDIPIVEWKLLETLERRLMSAAKKGPR